MLQHTSQARVVVATDSVDASDAGVSATAFSAGAAGDSRTWGKPPLSRADVEAARVFDGYVLWLTDEESVTAFARFCDPNGQVGTQVVRTDNPETEANVA